VRVDETQLSVALPRGSFVVSAGVFCFIMGKGEHLAKAIIRQTKRRQTTAHLSIYTGYGKHHTVLKMYQVIQHRLAVGHAELGGGGSQASSDDRHSLIRTRFRVREF